MNGISDRHYYIARDWLAVTAVTAVATSVACRALAGAWGARWPLQLAGASAIGAAFAAIQDEAPSRKLDLIKSDLKKAKTSKEVGEIARTYPKYAVLQPSLQHSKQFSVPFLDAIAQRKDIFSDEAWKWVKQHLCPNIHDRNHQTKFTLPTEQGQLSEKTVDKLLDADYGEGRRGASILLHITRFQPARQAQILKLCPLNSSYVQLTINNTLEWPELHETTVANLLNNQPSEWDLAFCLSWDGDASSDLNKMDIKRLSNVEAHMHRMCLYPQPRPVLKLYQQLNNDKLIELITEQHPDRRGSALEYMLQRVGLDDATLLRLIKQFEEQDDINSVRDIVKHRPYLFLNLSETLQTDVAGKIDGATLAGVLDSSGKLLPCTRLRTVCDAYAHTKSEAGKKALQERLIEEVERTPIDEIGKHLNISLMQKLMNAEKEAFFKHCRRRDLFYMMQLFQTDLLVEEAKKQDIPQGEIEFTIPFLMWMCECKKDDIRDVIGFALRQDKLPDYNHNLENEVTKAHVCWWLACTVRDSDRQVHDSLKQQVKDNPSYYGQAMGSWESVKIDALGHAKWLVEAFELSDSQSHSLMSALIPEAGDRAFEKVDREKLLKWGSSRQIAYSSHGGNDVIKVLHDKLTAPDHGHYLTKVEDSKTKVNLSNDMLYYLCTFLSPFDVGNLAITCKDLFHRLTNDEGVRVWQKKGLGSIGAVRDMYRLLKEVHNDWLNYLSNRGIWGKRLPITALIFAWPEQLLPTLHKHIFHKKTDKKDPFPLLADDLLDGWRKLHKEDDGPEPGTLHLRAANQVARYFREKPEEAFSKLNWEEGDVSLLEPIWKLLVHQLETRLWEQRQDGFGLPLKALLPFCEALTAQWPTHAEVIREHLLPLLNLARKDHPHFDFKGKVPEELLT